jgi:hypothetical protein
MKLEQFTRITDYAIQKTEHLISAVAGHHVDMHLGFFMVWFTSALALALALVCVWNRAYVRWEEDN